MMKPQNGENRKINGGPKSGAKQEFKEKNWFCLARRMGEHLVCSPCGELAWCSVRIDWPGPEVLLSRLPECNSRIIPFCLTLIACVGCLTGQSRSWHLADTCRNQAPGSDPGEAQFVPD